MRRLALGLEAGSRKSSQAAWSTPGRGWSWVAAKWPGVVSRQLLVRIPPVPSCACRRSADRPWRPSAGRSGKSRPELHQRGSPETWRVDDHATGQLRQVVACCRPASVRLRQGPVHCCLRLPALHRLLASGADLWAERLCMTFAVAPGSTMAPRKLIQIQEISRTIRHPAAGR